MYQPTEHKQLLGCAKIDYKIFFCLGVLIFLTNQENANLDETLTFTLSLLFW